MWLFKCIYFCFQGGSGGGGDCFNGGRGSGGGGCDVIYNYILHHRESGVDDCMYNNDGSELGVWYSSCGGCDRNGIDCGGCDSGSSCGGCGISGVGCGSGGEWQWQWLQQHLKGAGCSTHPRYLCCSERPPCQVFTHSNLSPIFAVKFRNVTFFPLLYYLIFSIFFFFSK